MMKTFITLTIILISFIQSTKSTPIVNGFARPNEPNLGVFPFQASLMQLMSDNRSYHSFCGGSLIHPQWILTAAHCIQLDATEPAMKPYAEMKFLPKRRTGVIFLLKFNRSQVYVALGSIYRNAQGAQILRVSQLTIHPTYLATDRNDIGLVKLRTSAKLGKNVNLVQLHLNNKENLIGKTAYLTGFGIIDDLYHTPVRLRKATLHINNYDNCFADQQTKNVEICATSSIREGKACKGDSGGPLTILENGRYIQIGITSHLAILPLCRISFNHSVYTRVSSYIAWISKITGINFTTYTRG